MKNEIITYIIFALPVILFILSWPLAMTKKFSSNIALQITSLLSTFLVVLEILFIFIFAIYAKDWKNAVSWGWMLIPWCCDLFLAYRKCSCCMKRKRQERTNKESL